MDNTPITKLDSSFNPNPYGVRSKINIFRDYETIREYGKTDTWEVGYVDDINVGEVIDLRNAAYHIFGLEGF